MAPDELAVNVPSYILEISQALLLQEQGQEIHLEEKIAELVEQLCVVAGDRRVGDLVRLLDGVRDDRARGLLAVPRTIAPQPPRQLLQLDESRGEAVQATGWLLPAWSSPGARTRSGTRSSCCSPSA